MVPVTSEIWSFVWHDNEVEGARWNRTVTSRTQVFLPSLIWLDRGDCHVEKMAHAIKAIIAAIATTTMMMSKVVFLCSRKGLNPTLQR